MVLLHGKTEGGGIQPGRAVAVFIKALRKPLAQRGRKRRNGGSKPFHGTAPGKEAVIIGGFALPNQQRIGKNVLDQLLIRHANRPVQQAVQGRGTPSCGTVQNKLADGCRGDGLQLVRPALQPLQKAIKQPRSFGALLAQGAQRLRRLMPPACIVALQKIDLGLQAFQHSPVAETGGLEQRIMRPAGKGLAV